MTREEIENLVAAEELALVGIVALGYDEAYRRFRDWLGEARHGEMGYLEGNDRFRRDPAQLLPGARRAVVLALPYHQGDTLDASLPRVAQYARFDDYHRVLWRRGERIVDNLRAHFGGDYRVLADSAPVLEKALATKSARGFQGKNTCFIHPTLGSFLLLGEILTTVELPADAPSEVDSRRRTADGGCGPCTACQVQCPTGALSDDYRIDARRCLAYWTIEHRGPIPEELWRWMGDYWFGCDLCQLACPYNTRAVGNRLPASLPPRALPPLFDVATMTEPQYVRWFAGTPLTRAKRGGLRRNALIALAVTGDPRLPEAMAQARRDPEPPLPDTLVQLDKYLSSL